MSCLLFPQACLDGSTRAALHTGLARAGGRPVHAGVRFVVPEGGWAHTSPFDGWVVPGWVLDSHTRALLDRLGLPALVVPLGSPIYETSVHHYVVWHTPPGVDPRCPAGDAQDALFEAASQQGWFAQMPYMHTNTSHQELAAAAAGGVLARFQPL